MTNARAEQRTKTRGRNPRGQGERLRDDLIAATLRLLDDLGDDEALSLRAVSREVGIAATSVYIHFADRDALVAAALERFIDELLEELHAAGAGNPAQALRDKVMVFATLSSRHPGIYKVLHESTVNQRVQLPRKAELARESAAAVQRCMDEGVIPQGDAAMLALDLRAAIHGTVALRLTEPQLNWPPLEEQVDRYIEKLVGLPASSES